jgi:hypothetical protein
MSERRRLSYHAKAVAEAACVYLDCADNGSQAQVDEAERLLRVKVAAYREARRA